MASRRLYYQQPVLATNSATRTARRNQYTSRTGSLSKVNTRDGGESEHEHPGAPHVPRTSAILRLMRLGRNLAHLLESLPHSRKPEKYAGITPSLLPTHRQAVVALSLPAVCHSSYPGCDSHLHASETTISVRVGHILPQGEEIPQAISMSNLAPKSERAGVACTKCPLVSSVQRKVRS